ncbi:hypothetical protein [Paraburkholderia sp. RL17-381-BIF-C]|uniref:hypothetical protein n=1 Tax=Paraburkholderia sp. RL17-381-BIF-C TaxID=3031635 RepID=UPI0038BADE63
MDYITKLGWNFVHVQAAGSVLLLVTVVIGTAILQRRLILTSINILGEMSDSTKATALWKNAHRYFERRDVNVFISPAHRIPVYFLLLVVLFCSMVTYFGAEFFSAPDRPVTPSYVLGGAFASMSAPKDLRNYQSGTVLIGSIAFLGAYLWTIAQLINRVNNDDISPATYYFLSIRIITACIFSGIARHVVEALPMNKFLYSGEVPVGLAALGFVIGWNPTLWIDQLVEQIGNYLKRKIPSQRWPAQSAMPLNMTLIFIQGLVPDKIERIRELDIDNFQKLAHENPLVIWVRTSYTLELVIDWIAQAQLCLLFDDEKVQLMRIHGIRDVFCFVETVNDSPSLKELSQLINVSEPLLSKSVAALTGCPAYLHLEELKSSL